MKDEIFALRFVGIQLWSTLWLNGTVRIVARSSFEFSVHAKCPMFPKHCLDVGFLWWCCDVFWEFRHFPAISCFLSRLRMGFVEGRREKNSGKYDIPFIFLRIHLGIHTASIETVQGAPTILYSIVMLLEKRCLPYCILRDARYI